MRKTRIGMLTDREIDFTLAVIAYLDVEQNGTCLVTEEGLTWEPTKRWSQLGPLLEKIGADLTLERYGTYIKRAIQPPFGGGGKYVATVGRLPAFADTPKRAVALAVILSQLGSVITLPDWI